MSKKTAMFLVALTSAFWGLSFTASNLLLKTMDPIMILQVRWTIASLIFGGMIAAGKLRFNFKKKGVKFLFLAAFLEPCCYSIFETYGLCLTSPSVSSIFIATIPCMSLIQGVLFFHGKAELKKIIAIALAFLGVAAATVLAPGFQAGGRISGYLLMIGAVFTGGLYSHASSAASRDYEPAAITAMMAFEGMVWFHLIGFLKGDGLQAWTIAFSTPKNALAVLFLGICCSAVCYLAYNGLLAYLEPSAVNNLSGSTTTIVGVGAGIVLAGDSWGLYTIAGLALTLAGVWLTSRDLGNSRK
ncbi:MAG: DMT family transporter [Eubacterium sp.]|jgi:drug/metabolite transporter (DMT)-like permease|nr:DMT family transporter [Eubacterium sp.]